MWFLVNYIVLIESDLVFSENEYEYRYTEPSF